MVAEFREFPQDLRHRGPNLTAVGIVYTALSLASFLIAVIVTRGSLPAPLGSGFLPRFYFAGYLPAVRVSAFLQFVAAIPLGIFTATAVSRMRFLGLNVAGVFIALVGGFGAALFMAIAGLFRWTLSEPALSTLPYASIIVRLLSFAVGSIGFTVLFGLLVAGISIIASFTGLLPQWLATFGLVIFVLAEIASLALLWNPLAILVPIVQFLGFIWIIAAGFLMPSRRSQSGQSRLSAVA